MFGERSPGVLLGSTLRLVPLGVLVVAPLAAQRSTDELLADLVTTDRAIGAQLELLRRGEPVAEALGRALRVGWQGHERESTARGAVTRVLMELGPAGAPAFEELVACVRDTEVDAETVRNAAMALEIVGPFAGEGRARFLQFLEAHPSWIGGGAGLLNRTFFERWGRVASSLSVDARSATVDELLAALRETDPFARVTASRALAARRAELDAERDRIADALRAALVEPLERRAQWTWAIGRRPQYAYLQEDVVRWLRTAASLALIAYAPEDELGMLGHSQRLFALDPAVRLDAVRALGRMRRPDAGRWLLDAAREGPLAISLEALAAIERTGPALSYLGPSLLELESTASAELRAAAQRARRLVAPDRDSVTPIRPMLEIVGVGLPADSSIPLVLETRRLEAWLDRDGGRNRALLQVDTRHIDRYHALSADDGGRFGDRIRWVPVRVEPDEFRPGYWAGLEQRPAGAVVSAAPPGAVGRERERLRPLPWIVELVPADRLDPVFSHEDCARLQRAPGARFFSFGIEPSRVDAFLDLKRALQDRGGSFAFVVDGLAIWLLSIGEQADVDHSGGGFALLPASRDRAGALEALLSR